MRALAILLLLAMTPTDFETEIEQAARRNDVITAIDLYERYEREPGFDDDSILLTLAFAITHPEVPTPNALGAASRVEAALRRAVNRDPDEFAMTAALAKMIARRNVQEGRAIVHAFLQRHPDDVEPRLELVRWSMKARDWNAVTGDMEAIVMKIAKRSDCAALCITADLASELSMRNEPSMAQRRKFAREAVSLARRAVRTRSGYRETSTLSTALRRLALHESDEAKRRKLIAEADQLSKKALKILRAAPR